MVTGTDDLNMKRSKSLSLPTGEGVVIDLGTGDGVFVYRSAHENPRKFYIGIEANPQPLAKVSEKLHRKPTKGGTPNALFLHAAVETLPPELNGAADEVHVHFPWGSLLRAVATGDAALLRSLRRVCAPDAMVEIVIGIDPKRDQAEIAQLGLPALTKEYLENTLAPRYEANGFEVVEHGVVDAGEWPKLRTSWAKRLDGGTERALMYLIVRAREGGV